MDKRNDVVVLRTGMVYEADMVAEALKDAGVPFYRRQETSSGLEFGMPVAAAPAPGLFWTILVPQKAVAEAKSIIEVLPVSQDLNPGVWDFGGSSRIKKVWRMIALFMVVWVLFGVGWNLIQAVAAWFGYLI